MKNMIFLFVLIACALPVVNAVPDSAIVGPYRISFDLGLPHDAYNVTIVPPMFEGQEKFATYSMNMNMNNETGLYQGASINLSTGYKIGTDVNVTGFIENLLKAIDNADPSDSNFHLATCTIDGMDGAVESMDFKVNQDLVLTKYHAIYLLSPDTLVDIVSIYPWYGGSLQLLKTIHVEKHPFFLS